MKYKVRLSIRRTIALSARRLGCLYSTLLYSTFGRATAFAATTLS